MAACKLKFRWFRFTPDRLLFALLPVWGGLFLSEHFRWFPKGYPVLLAAATFVVFLAVLMPWFVVALLFRWQFQYSLRTLLLAVLLASIGMNWIGIRVRKARLQKEVVQEIRKSNGFPAYDYDTKPIGASSFPGKPKLACLLGEDFLASVVSVGFYDNGPIGHSGIQCLKDLPQLEALDLNSTYADDGTLEHLPSLPQLRDFYLNRTEVTDAGLRHVERLPNLVWLGFGENAKITDQGLRHLEGLANLQRLWICDNAQITEDGVKRLQRALPNCEIEYRAKEPQTSMQ